jgi:hypothetical protein
MVNGDANKHFQVGIMTIYNRVEAPAVPASTASACMTTMRPLQGNYRLEFKDLAWLLDSAPNWGRADSDRKFWLLSGAARLLRLLISAKRGMVTTVRRVETAQACQTSETPYKQISFYVKFRDQPPQK